MTISEIQRAVNSKLKVKKIEAQEKATFDYTLANLFAKSMARLYSSSARLPEISEVYPTLFDSEAIKQQRQEKLAELSALRFKQFAQAHNKKFTQEGAKNE